jgi:hypothetical protein
VADHRRLPESSQNMLVLYPFIFAVLPAVAWYWGTSQVGWTVGSYNEVIRLTEASALQVNILFYCVMVASVAIIGYFIHWMSEHLRRRAIHHCQGHHDRRPDRDPLFITGLVGFYPVLWIDLLIGVVAISWAVYLMYLGIPIVMDIPQERGFLFSSAILAIAWLFSSASWSCRSWPGTSARRRPLPTADQRRNERLSDFDLAWKHAINWASGTQGTGLDTDTNGNGSRINSNYG